MTREENKSAQGRVNGGVTASDTHLTKGGRVRVPLGDSTGGYRSLPPSSLRDDDPELGMDEDNPLPIDKLLR